MLRSISAVLSLLRVQRRAEGFARSRVEELTDFVRRDRPEGIVLPHDEAGVAKLLKMLSVQAPYMQEGLRCAVSVLKTLSPLDPAKFAEAAAVGLDCVGEALLPVAAAAEATYKMLLTIGGELGVAKVGDVAGGGAVRTGTAHELRCTEAEAAAFQNALAAFAELSSRITSAALFSPSSPDHGLDRGAVSEVARCADAFRTAFETLAGAIVSNRPKALRTMRWASAEIANQLGAQIVRYVTTLELRTIRTAARGGVNGGIAANAAGSPEAVAAALLEASVLHLGQTAEQAYLLLAPEAGVGTVTSGFLAAAQQLRQARDAKDLAARCAEVIEGFVQTTQLAEQMLYFDASDRVREVLTANFDAARTKLAACAAAADVAQKHPDGWKRACAQLVTARANGRRWEIQKALGFARKDADNLLAKYETGVKAYEANAAEWARAKAELERALTSLFALLKDATEAGRQGVAGEAIDGTLAELQRLWQSNINFYNPHPLASNSVPHFVKDACGPPQQFVELTFDKAGFIQEGPGRTWNVYRGEWVMMDIEAIGCHIVVPGGRLKRWQTKAESCLRIEVPPGDATFTLRMRVDSKTPPSKGWLGDAKKVAKAAAAAAASFVTGGHIDFSKGPSYDSKEPIFKLAESKDVHFGGGWVLPITTKAVNVPVTAWRLIDPPARRPPAPEAASSPAAAASSPPTEGQPSSAGGASAPSAPASASGSAPSYAAVTAKQPARVGPTDAEIRRARQAVTSALGLFPKDRMSNPGEAPRQEDLDSKEKKQLAADQSKVDADFLTLGQVRLSGRSLRVCCCAATLLADSILYLQYSC